MQPVSIKLAVCQLRYQFCVLIFLKLHHHITASLSQGNPNSFYPKEIQILSSYFTRDSFSQNCFFVPEKSKFFQESCSWFSINMQLFHGPTLHFCEDVLLLYVTGKLGHLIANNCAIMSYFFFLKGFSSLAFSYCRRFFFFLFEEIFLPLLSFY